MMVYLFWLPIIKMNWFLFSLQRFLSKFIKPLDYIRFSRESSNFKPHCEYDLKEFCRKCMEKNCRNAHLRDLSLAGCCHFIQMGDLTSIKLSDTYHKGTRKDISKWHSLGSKTRNSTACINVPQRKTQPKHESS